MADMRGDVLVVDVGNTVTSLGIVRDGALADTWCATTAPQLTADEARGRIKAFLDDVPEGAALADGIIASVVPGITDAWVQAVRRMTGRRPLVVGPGLKTGIKMRYDNPSELGADRVADLAGALGAYEPPFVLVDLGTTTNFAIVDKAGTFQGGIIAPGLRMGARAMADAAAQLAVIELRAPRAVVGKSTREAMQAGLVMGEVARIDGLVDAVWAELGYETPVIATGEDGQAMAALSARITSFDEHLTLRGLAALHTLNRR